ncbi:MAG: flagellar filament capping protein FliD [bacterium]
MASIQSLGVGSGLLTSDLVEDIISAEREGTDLRLDAKRAEYEAKISAFGAVRSGIDGLSAAVRDLGSSTSLLSNVVTSSNENAITASASATAKPGIHTVEVLATARAHTLTSVRYDTIDTVVGSGTIDVRFGATTFAGGNYDSFTENPDRASGQIVIDSSNNTVSGIRDAINAADLGVVASIVNDGEGFILVLTSDRTGEDQSMELTVTEDSPAGLSALNFNLADNVPGTNMTQTVDADDAIVVIDGITVSRDTNTINEVIPGVTFTAVGNNAGAPATVSINQDTQAVSDKMQAFVDAYNSVKTLTDDLTDFDEEKGIGALLTGDSTVRTLMSQLRRFMSRSVMEVESSSLRALVDLGISTNQNAGFQLQFDATQFAQNLVANPADVSALLAEQRRSSDNQIAFVGFQSATQAGSYIVDIQQAATQGVLNGAGRADLDNTIVIDDDNDTLSVTVDGVSSSTITLAQGSYADGAELAVELQTQINQDAALRAANATVDVSYDVDTQSLQIRSTSFGSRSSIGIDSVDANTTAQLGLSVIDASSNVGTDVEGTVNGIEGNGVGQFLSIPNGPTPATSGSYNGSILSSFDSGSLTIDGSNGSFRINIDGFQSGDIVLTPGEYSTPAELASEMTARINADALLVAGEVTATVAYDVANNRFEITSDSTGPSSTVNVTSVSAGVVSDLGLTVGIGAPGRRAAETADPAAGIQLRVQGEAVGERGTVTLVRGVMNQIDSFLDQFVNFGGSLANKLDSLEGQVEAVEDEASEFSKRMDLLEARLRTQFAAADALISTLDNTSQFLDRQLATLPGYTRESN